MSIRALCLATALTLSLPMGVLAHGGEHADEDESGADVALAPGWGELAFSAPVPGSYALPPLFPAADGAVLTSSGEASSLHQELGSGVALLSFIYASCSDVNGCPLATAVFQKLRARLAQRPTTAARVRLVSLSFDPERDTPDVMRRYGESFERGGLAWRFLTTTGSEQLAPLLDAYGQSLVREVDAEGNERDPIAHILRVFLVDGEKRVRNVYTVSYLHPDTLIADLETILLEADAGAPDATPSPAPAIAASTRGSGDDRTGYASPDYRSRSVSLAARRGVPADLAGRLESPPLGLPPPEFPSDNPPTPAKIALGRMLFFDRRLSHNETFSCAMCHIPEQGFANNELATAVGIEGRSVRRNAPTILNVAYVEKLFHDGREGRLENQVWGPLLARNEMGNPSIGAVLDRVASDPGYTERFDEAFPGRGLSVETLGMALASYERSLLSGDSPFDRWQSGSDAGSPAARRGFALFTGRAGCNACHPVTSPLFSDGAFHNTGIGFARSMELSTRGSSEPSDSGTQRIQVAPGSFLEVERSITAKVAEPPASDLGRYEITGDPADRWRYRTPTLRNVGRTAPYMHDGSLATLEDVVSFYDRGGVPNEGLDPRIRPLGLSATEAADLAAFLESLTGSDLETLVSDAFAAPVGERE